MSIVFSDRFRYTLIVSFYKERIFLKHSLIRFSAVVLTIAFVFALTGCGSGSNSFTWFVDSIPANLDPQVASASADVIACENLYSGLVRKDPSGKYEPALCERWEKSSDGLTYTFHLRENVQFNDGTPFNAEAVKLYFDNMKSVIGTSANYGQFDMLTTEITVDDEYTVSFHLSRPYYNVLNDLSMVMPRGILSAAAFNEDGSLNTEYLMTHTRHGPLYV